MKVLVVAAHPDDEVLGCGATVARLAEEGHEVFIGILGEGATSRYDRRDHADLSLVRDLAAQAQGAAEILGVQAVEVGDLPDNRFDTVPLLDIIKVVEGWIVDREPELIFTHHSGDLNIDHQLVSRAVLTATRPTAAGGVREILAFEVPSSTEWAFQRLEPVFRADVFYDVASTLARKIDALSAYEQEARAFPHPRSAAALRAYAQRWGSVVGLEAAEAFELIRTLR